jgi:hypothetical protein
MQNVVMLTVISGEFHLCWVSQVSSICWVRYADVLLSVVILNVVMLNCICAECRSIRWVCYAECRYAECRYAECRYAECRHAECRGAADLNKLVLGGQQYWSFPYIMNPFFSRRRTLADVSIPTRRRRSWRRRHRHRRHRSRRSSNEKQDLAYPGVDAIYFFTRHWRTVQLS